MNSRTVSVQTLLVVICSSVVKVAQAREWACVQFLAFVTLIFFILWSGTDVWYPLSYSMYVCSSDVKTKRPLNWPV